MSLAVDLQSRPTSGPGNFPDEHAVTQVEKWMAIIREISQERLSSDSLPAPRSTREREWCSH